MSGFSAKRFSALADLTEGENAVLEGLGDRGHIYQAKRIIRLEGEHPPQLFLLLNGWAASFVTLRDGKRQFLKLHMEGDVIGAPSLPLIKAADSLMALTDCLVAEISKTALADVFAQHPRLAMLFFLAAQQERVILMDRLISVGRTNAMERVAAVLLHLQERLAAAQGEKIHSFDLPLTQEQIGDVVGLTPIHVNRIMRRLTVSGLIRREGRRLSLIDLPALRTLSGIPERDLERNADWLLPLTK